ncbi:hypothetical protein ACB092_03G155700 [Castanea dentata]
MEGRVRMRWTMALILVGLMFMATKPNMAEGVFFVTMDPCYQSNCENACKAILKEKFMSAHCYRTLFCMCFG